MVWETTSNTRKTVLWDNHTGHLLVVGNRTILYSWCVIDYLAFDLVLLWCPLWWIHATRIITGTKKHEHISPALRELNFTIHEEPYFKTNFVHFGTLPPCPSRYLLHSSLLVKPHRKLKVSELSIITLETSQRVQNVYPKKQLQANVNEQSCKNITIRLYLGTFMTLWQVGGRNLGLSFISLKQKQNETKFKFIIFS